MIHRHEDRSGRTTITYTTSEQCKHGAPIGPGIPICPACQPAAEHVSPARCEHGLPIGPSYKVCPGCQAEHVVAFRPAYPEITVCKHGTQEYGMQRCASCASEDADAREQRLLDAAKALLEAAGYRVEKIT